MACIPCSTLPLLMSNDVSWDPPIDMIMIIMIMIINLTIGHSRSSLPVQTYVQQQL